MTWTVGFSIFANLDTMVRKLKYSLFFLLINSGLFIKLWFNAMGESSHTLTIYYTDSKHWASSK